MSKVPDGNLKRFHVMLDEEVADELRRLFPKNSISDCIRTALARLVQKAKEARGEGA